MPEPVVSSDFQSELMTLCHMYLPTDAAFECTSEVGELGQVQFRDLNPDTNAFQRKYVSEIRRCEEMERQLRLLISAMEKDKIPMLDYKDNPRAPPPKEMTDMEATFQKLEDELKEINGNSEALRQTFLELTEMKHILQKAQRFFDEKDQSIANDEMDITLVNANDRACLSFIAGVIYREKVPNFERMLWRVCHGNMLLRQAPIEVPLEEPHSGDPVEKNVFMVFFQGDQLRTRVKKICTAFHATIYPVPESQSERADMLRNIMTRLEDLTTVRGQTEDHRNRVLVAAARKVKTWMVKVRKIKAIYHTLNMCNFDVTAKCLIAECWCPVRDLELIQKALQRGKERSGTEAPAILHRIETPEIPPTYNRSNKFTSGFQNIIDAYGIASYQEINPMPYTVITFPFLFAVMFGDAGHGLLMTLFAAVLVIKERQIAAARIKDEIVQTFFGGRYIILFMGIFSIYTGILYNDVFAKAINIFGSGWKVECNTPDLHCFEHVELTPEKNFDNITYPFGIDPVWAISGNKIPFTNSYKMKMSVILGVIQMLFGVFLSLYNHMYFRHYINIFCEFIPQLLFMCAIFGYLCVTMFAKWATNYNHETGCAPSLLIMLINMFMFSHDAEGMSCYQLSFYKAQPVVESILVIIAVVCIPWMLLIKPLILRRRWQNKQRFNAVMATATGHLGPAADEEDGANGGITKLNGGKVAEAPQPPKGGAGGGGHGHGSDDNFEFGDVMINQIIHTIEYCLGSVSHTASYLRLWALSLAHAQLSEVLWTMVFRMGLTFEGYVGAILMYLIFAAWGCLTITILLVMEGLSAFLHALRLHWVEFQSKFYHGEGYAFIPFSLKQVMEED